MSIAKNSSSRLARAKRVSAVGMCVSLCVSPLLSIVQDWIYLWRNIEGAVRDVEVPYYENEEGHGGLLCVWKVAAKRLDSLNVSRVN